MKTRKLTEKQKRFCNEYMIDMNASASAERAGYSKNRKGEIGYQLLQKTTVQQYISHLKSRISEKLNITHEMLTKEWAKMAFNSMAHLHNTWMERKSFEEIKKGHPEILDSIQEIQTQKKVMRGISGDLEEVEFVKIKLYSKQTALENLGKHIGYYEADNRQKSQLSVIKAPTDEKKKIIENID